MQTFTWCGRSFLSSLVTLVRTDMISYDDRGEDVQWTEKSLKDVRLTYIKTEILLVTLRDWSVK